MQNCSRQYSIFFIENTGAFNTFAAVATDTLRVNYHSNSHIRLGTADNSVDLLMFDNTEFHQTVFWDDSRISSTIIYNMHWKPFITIALYVIP